MKVLCQNSGGYDSVAACLKLLREGHEVKGLFFDLGQDYVEQERYAARYTDEFFKKRFPNWQGLVEEQVSMRLAADYSENSPVEYIPVRNLVLAAHSANIAIAEGYETVAVGSKTVEVRPDDPYSFADSSWPFYNKLNDVMRAGTEKGDALQFIMPLVDDEFTPMKKSEVVNMLYNEGMNFMDLWTCYGTGNKSCGQCYHCKEAKKAFKEANINIDGLFES